MKRTYIKPECEVLPGELNGILCVSGDYKANFEGQGGVTNNNNNDDDDLPATGRETFFFDEEF